MGGKLYTKTNHSMGYYVDLSAITIDQYSRILESANLLPSRVILLQDLEKNFNLLKTQGILHLEGLLKALSTKEKIQAMAETIPIKADYLTVLAREIKSYRQKPNRFRDFPGLAAELVEKLEAAGVKNTLQLYDRILTPAQRGQLSEELEMGEADVVRLTKLTDLSRVRWVNHTFAYVLLEAGYDTAGKVAQADFQLLYETIKQLNQERQIYKGHIGLNDMKRCVEAAQELALEIVY